MEFALQFGYGMMAHTSALIEEWGAGQVVLSPRDLTDEQICRMAAAVASRGGEPLIDPQFYLPHSEHERLHSHAYWPDEFEEGHTLSPQGWASLLAELRQLNQRAGVGRCILPGVLATSPLDFDEWLAQHSVMLQEAERLGLVGAAGVLTLALGSTVLTDTPLLDQVLEYVETAPVDWVYLVAEHPSGDYMIKDPIWLANLLDLVAGIRMAGKHVIVGYCQQQMLLLAAAGADVVASGTWMNVRSFPPEKFRGMYDDEIRKRKVWYYCPQALSEYGITYLDVAARRGVLGQLHVPSGFDRSYADRLFMTSQPSSIAWRENEAFRHYLVSLKRQVESVECDSFDDALRALRGSIDAAERMVSTLASVGVRGQGREFDLDASQACAAALDVLDADRGAMLRRRWAELHQ